MSATGHQRRRRREAAKRVIESGADLAAFVEKHGLNCEADAEGVYAAVENRTDAWLLAEDAERAKQERLEKPESGLTLQEPEAAEPDPRHHTIRQEDMPVGIGPIALKPEPEAEEPSDGPELHQMRAAEVRAYAEEILGYDPGTKKAAIAALEAAE